MHVRTKASSLPAVIRRRYSAAGAVVTMAAALALASPAAPADAAPLATATFSGHATSSILQTSAALGPPGTLAVSTDLAPASANVSRNASSATASNLLAKITGFPAINVQTLTANAPPPQTVGPTTLIPIPAAPLLDVKLLTGLAKASWPKVGTCPAATVPASLGKVSTAAATFLSSAALPPLLTTSAATTQSTTQLVSASGPVGTDTRAVQAQATNTISTIDLGGGSTKGGVSITINKAPTLTGTATGSTATSKVKFAPGGGTITIGVGGTTNALSPGISVPISFNLGVATLSGSIKLNAGATGVVNTGTSVAGDAALLTISLIARVREAQVAAVNVAVAPLHVDATSPKDGIQCATVTPTPSVTLTPTIPTTPPIPSGPPQTGAGGTAGLQNAALIALGLTLLVSGAGAGSLAYRRRRAGHAG